jgi:hypothetical protein
MKPKKNKYFFSGNTVEEENAEKEKLRNIKGFEGSKDNCKIDIEGTVREG